MANTFLVERLRGLGFTLVQNIKQNLPSASGELIRSVGFEVTSDGAAVTLLGVVKGPAGNYWQFVDKGRGPGKPPPVSTIREWIDQIGLVPEGDTSKDQVAFLIARSIGRKGTKGTNAFSDAIDNLDFTAIEEAAGKDMAVLIREMAKNFNQAA